MNKRGEKRKNERVSTPIAIWSGLKQSHTDRDTRCRKRGEGESLWGDERVLSVVCVGLQTYRFLVELKWVISSISPSKDGRQEEVKKGEKRESQVRCLGWSRVGIGIRFLLVLAVDWGNENEKVMKRGWLLAVWKERRV